jgi:hypothetical protein
VKLLTVNERRAAIRLARYFCVRRTGCLQRLRGSHDHGCDIHGDQGLQINVDLRGSQSPRVASAEALSYFRET